MKNSSLTSTAQDSYIRVPDFEDRLDGLEFPPEVWAVFSQTERAVSIQVMAEKSGLAPDVVASAIRRLVRRKLVRKHLLNWRDYLAQAQLAPNKENTESSKAAFLPPSAPLKLEQTPPVTILMGEGEAEPVKMDAPLALTVPPWSLVEPEEAIVSVRIVDDGATDERLKARANLVRFHLAAERTSPKLASDKSSNHVSPSASNQGGWRLRPLLDAIINRVGGLAGQFLVYRIFLRLPVELVEAAGIKSLSLVSDDFKIYDPRLREAICEAARELAGLELAEIKA